MRNLRFAALAAALIAAALWFQHESPEHPTAPSLESPSPTVFSSTPPTSHVCSSGSCSHEHAAPVTSRRIKSSPAQSGWQSALPGVTAQLGFRIGRSDEGHIVSRHRFDDGRIAIGMALPGGHDLHIVVRGNEWEGRALSKDGSNGFKLHGNEHEIHIEETEHEALICAVVGEDGLQSAGLPVPEAGNGEPGEDPLPEPESIVVPTLNSRLGANGVLYLDFDGETVTGTQWNSSYNGGAPIVAAEAALTETQIERVWAGIAEDYRPFNLNVTTDRSVFESYPVNRRAMLIFSPTIEWYTTSGGVGGVAYVDIFGSSSFDYPGWVFTAALSNNASNCHEAGSHEAGHILGLRHDATSTQDYYAGHGSGATSWGPIMGVAYSRTVSQFSIGEYNDANNSEDDLAIITKAYNGLGYMADDHANTTGGATPVNESGVDAIDAEGLIETNTDVDVFSFQTSGGAVVINANNGSVDPNLDIRMRLLNSSGAEVAVADSLSTLDATLSTTLSSGLHYLEVTGTGTGNPSTGYSDYGSLGGYTLSGSVPRVLVLAADILSPSSPQVSLPEGTGLYLDGLTSGASPVWEVVTSPPGGSAQLSSPGSDATRVTFTQPGLYRLRLSVTAGPEQESDEIEVSVEPAGATPAFAARAPGINLGPSRSVYNNRTTLAPVVSDDGLPGPPSYEWQVLSGDGQLSNPSIANPEITFATASTTTLRLSVSDGDHRTFGEVDLTAVFFSSVLIAEDADARVAMADSSTFAANWKAIAYDDSAWTSGGLGAGYDLTKGNSARRIFLPLIGTLDLESAMAGSYAGCLMRIPFEVGDPQEVLSLMLRMKFDDGFVAYLNGVEIARMNAPAGSPAWNTLAPTDRFDEEALSAVGFPIDLSSVPLVAGTNVLAIHGMNFDSQPIKGNSGDPSFLLVPSLEGIETQLPESPFLTAVSLVADPEMRDEQDDADGDGRSNLYEHAAGTDLNSPDGNYPMVGPADPSVIGITLPENPPSDVRYLLEYNETLGGMWTEMSRREGDGTWQGTAPAMSSPAPGSREFIEFPCPTSGRGFFRLRFERIQP